MRLPDAINNLFNFCACDFRENFVAQLWQEMPLEYPFLMLSMFTRQSRQMLCFESVVGMLKRRRAVREFWIDRFNNKKARFSRNGLF